MFNREADLLPSTEALAETIKPAFKVGTRVFQIQDAKTCEAITPSDDTDTEKTDSADIDIKNLQNKQSVFWDDADDSDTISEGDRWIRLYSQCEEPVTQKYTTGTIYYTNIHNQQEVLTGEAAQALQDMGVQMRLQISYDQGASVPSILYENFSGTFSRNLETGSYFSVDSGSLSTAENGDQQYIFDFETASVSYIIDEEGDFETISFSGRYYDSELDGYVIIDNLNIELDYEVDLIDSIVLTINQETDNATVTYAGNTVSLALGEKEVEAELGDLFGAGDIKVIAMD
jgi:hypothetical protein